MPRVQIRTLTRHDEFRQCERIQEIVWGGVSAASEVLRVAHEYGGAVLGALTQGRVVGFILALLARRNGRLIHWSHLMAVLPRWRDRGLGFRMKLAHRRRALAQGIGSICWTYDPLQTRNAALNLGRLGATVEEYVADYYGPFPSVIEKGLPSDRFVVNWRIASAAVGKRLRDGLSPRRNLSWPRVNDAAFDQRGFLENRKLRFGLSAPRLLVEIPIDTDRMREKNLSLARRWRLEARKIFKRYFACGYRVEDFIPPETLTDGRGFYVLARRARRAR